MMSYADIAEQAARLRAHPLVDWASAYLDGQPRIAVILRDLHRGELIDYGMHKIMFRGRQRNTTDVRADDVDEFLELLDAIYTVVRLRDDA